MDVASRQQKLPRDGAILLLDTFEKKIASLAKEGKFVGNVLYDICSDDGLKSTYIIANVKKIADSHYDDVPSVSGMYEGRLKLSEKIEKEMQAQDEKSI